MTSMEDSMKMQAIAILLATNDCPRVIKKRLYDELLNLAKIKLPENELKEYEEVFKPGQSWARQIVEGHGYNYGPFSRDGIEPSAASPPIQTQPLPLPSDPLPFQQIVFRKPEEYSNGELAFGLAKDMNFRYAIKRSPATFILITKMAQKIVEEQDETGEPRGF